jgi:large subunit ribosomal protein L10
MSAAKVKPQKVSAAIEGKMKRVVELSELIKKHRWVGLADIARIPAANMTQLRRSLRGTLLIRASKKTLIKRAIEECAKSQHGLEKLIPQIKGNSALLVSNENPFKVQKSLLKLRTQLPAKGGEISPMDILIPAGPTNFKPGPIVSDLQKVGIQAGIEASKVVVKKDKLLVKKGETISRDVAAIITKMDIKPLEVGLDMLCVYESGTIYDSSVLMIDEEKIESDMRIAHAESIALALGISWLNDVTLPILIGKARRQAIAIAQAVAYVTPDTVEMLVIRASAEMAALATHVPDAKVEGVSVATTTGAQAAPEPQKKQEEKKEERKSVDEAASGLSSLFG